MRKVLCGFGLAVVGVTVLCVAVVIVYSIATAVERATLCYDGAKCIEETWKGVQPYLRPFGGS